MLASAARRGDRPARVLGPGASRALGLVLVVVALVLAAGVLLGAANEVDASVSRLVLAQRLGEGGTATVPLPDMAQASRGEARPIQRHYRWVVADLQRGAAVFFPQLNGHARVEVNGEVVSDALAEGMKPLPRGPNRIVLLDIPDRLWRPGANVIDVTVAGPEWISISTLYVGPAAHVRQMYEWRILLVIVGPMIVAAVIGTLGLFMLVLWTSRRDAIYGYFGAGTLGWALHTAWTILPWWLLPGDQYVVWIHSLYWIFVTMLIVFCVRFTGGKWPRFEAVLLAMAIATPLWLSVFTFVFPGRQDTAVNVVSFGLACLAAVGLTAVTLVSYRRLDLNKILVLAFAFVSSVLGFHDFYETATKVRDNPVPLVPYSGVLFVVFVVRMLVDRFETTSRDLEALNAELEQRVAAQNAALRDTMEQMRAARDVAESADRAKTRFLAAASHDLRQPAHALALYMGALREGRLDPGQADLVARMDGSLSALESMFSVLLDVSRVDAGALKPDIRSFPIVPLLRRLTDEFAPQAEARGLRLAVRLPADSARASSDPALVERIVRNLLANAVKYTSRGGVLLACRRRAGPPEQWRIEVWDTGIGISAADQTRVFEEFYQADNPGRDRSLGLGLGLSIVQRLCRLLDAPLQMRSELGRGSCFALGLPVASAQRVEAATQADASSLAGMRVAMIEDDLEVRAAMRVLLTRWGCEILEGADAQELDAGLQGRPPPDVLLADHRLAAGRTGRQEAETLFARWGVRVPLIVVTGESNVGDMEASGCVCLAKPVSPTVLRHSLALSRRR